MKWCPNYMEKALLLELAVEEIRTWGTGGFTIRDVQHLAQSYGYPWEWTYLKDSFLEIGFELLPDSESHL